MVMPSREITQLPLFREYFATKLIPLFIFFEIETINATDSRV